MLFVCHFIILKSHYALSECHANMSKTHVVLSVCNVIISKIHYFLSTRNFYYLQRHYVLPNDSVIMFKCFAVLSVRSVDNQKTSHHVFSNSCHAKTSCYYANIDFHSV